jgi:hypothetical protein
MVVHACNSKLGSLRQEDLKFQDILDYIMRACLKKLKTKILLRMLMFVLDIIDLSKMRQI